ncbi:MAG: hypothetical protein WBA12_04650 [Catalinimonas sp.]
MSLSLRSFFRAAALLSAFLLLTVSCKTKDEKASLSDIAGDWVMTSGDNVDEIGMRLTVNGNTGTITNEANSPLLSTGDVRWLNVSPETDKTFTYEELAFDGNYYDATLTIVNDSTLRVSVDDLTSGGNQTWMRNMVGPINAVELACDAFTSNIVLENGPSPVDYIISCSMTASAQVTVEAGTVIHFKENSAIDVTSSGSFRAVGSATAPIVFRGTENTEGWWRGIYFASPSNNNQLEHVTIQDAGSERVRCCDEPATLYQASGKLSLKNVTLRNGDGNGINARPGGEFTAYENVRITTHDEYPLILPVSRLSEIDGTDSDYSGNEEDFFFISGNISDDVVLPKINIPYLMSGIVGIGAGLTIEAGAEIAMVTNAGIRVDSDGSLSIEGTSDDPVVIRGAEATSGYWRGIYLNSNSGRNRINYARISDAGSDRVACCDAAATLYLSSGRATVTNSTFSNGKSFGITATREFEFVEYANNTVTTHDEYPLNISLARVDELDGLGSNYGGNDKDFINVVAATLNDEVTWQETDVPYRFTGVGNIEARMDFDPGVEVVFSVNAGMGIYGTGILNAVGTSDKKIIFRGEEDEVGQWRGLDFNSNSGNNELTHVNISNAGSERVFCCSSPAAVFVRGGRLKITQTRIAKTKNCALRIGSSADVDRSDLSFSGNDDDICE